MTITVYHIPPPKNPKPVIQAECSHNFRMVKMVCSNGALQFKNQCKICGKTTENIPRSSISNPDKLPLYDTNVRENYYNERNRQTTDYEDASHKWWEWYNGYLRSNAWKEKRMLVMERAGGHCESCRRERAIEVHHLTYERVGREPLYDLVAVCKGCHDQIKEIKYNV